MIAKFLYNLDQVPPPRSKFYARAASVLQELKKLQRAETIERGLWVWKRTPEEEAEIGKLHAEIFDDTRDRPPTPGLPVCIDPSPPGSFVPGPPVVVTMDGPEEIPEGDDS